MQKKITLISLNFFPEDTAIGLYSTQMAEYLSSNGAEVTVVTAFPYYPQWKIWNAYKDRKSFIREKKGDINILRYKQYVPRQPSFFKRVLHIVDFSFGTWRNLNKIKECDIVISIIPFTSSAWLGNMLSRKRNAKHWIHIQDFEFDAAFQSGLTSNAKPSGIIHTQLMKLESKILNKADCVSTISNTMLTKLATKTEARTYFLPNWIDVNASNPKNTRQHPFISKDKFTILYSGNVGDKQDWSLFENVCRGLDFNIFEVILVGAGAKMDDLKNTLKDLPIKWHNPVPLKDLASLLASTNLHILFQKTDVKDTVMPSKILGMMASARPSIVTGNEEAEPSIIFSESGGGYYESIPDAKLIIDRILYLRKNPDVSEKMGQAARDYIVNKFSKLKILHQFNKQLSRL